MNIAHRLDARWPIPGWKRLVCCRSVEHGIEVIRVLHGAQDVETVIAAEPAT